MEWYNLAHSEYILSPALLFFPDRIENNIKKMISTAGSADKLRPHIKTFKCAEIIKLYQQYGINKFKCATLAEAELLATAESNDVLLAYPLVGPNCDEYVRLVEQYPATKFSVLVDSEEQLNFWELHINTKVNVFIDIDCGMHRTGIPIENADQLYQKIKNSSLTFSGFHAYDGHIHDNELDKRTQHVLATFNHIDQIAQKVRNECDRDIEFICGGSITFSIHAKYPDRQLSPGTTVLWDYGYHQSYPDLEFDIAATVFTRVISKIGKDKICLDLGHKAVASEMTDLRVYFPELPNAQMIGHSEEHLVLNVQSNTSIEIGQGFVGFPWHICPTVALHEEAICIHNNNITNTWKITARKRKYLL